MSHKLLTLNVRGLNTSRKRRQVFFCLHLQRSDIIFLQETYSSTATRRTILPFVVTKEVKLSMFHYKIIHNILCTKSLLFKMKKEDSPRCPLCPADHTILHLFTECAQATLFWKEILDWASCIVNSKLSLSTKEIIFGIININDSKFCSPLNHLVIIGKYFLYVKAPNSKGYIFNEFVSLARLENLRICSSSACVYRLMDACGKFGEHERCVRVVRGAAESNSSFLSALQTSQVHP